MNKFLDNYANVIFLVLVLAIPLSTVIRIAFSI